MPGKPLKLNIFLLPFGIALVSAAVLAININKPFIGQHDYNAVQEGNAAKNYLQYGVFNLKFGQVVHPIRFTDDGKINPDQTYYTTYLPVAPLLISLSFFVFGVREWAERLVPLLFSATGVFFLYLICRKVWNARIGLIASFLYIFNPMFIYYGKMPVPEPLITGMVLASFYVYLLWLEGGRNRTFILLCALLFLTGLIGWPVVYFIPLVFLHSWLVQKFSRKLFVLGLVIFATLVIQFFHEYILTGKLIGGYMLTTLQRRLGEANLSFGGVDFSLVNYLKQEASWFQAYFTRVMLVLSAVGLAANVSLKVTPQKAALIFWLLFGLAHPVFFSRMVFIHDYLNFYLLPFLAVSGSLGLRLLVRTCNTRIKLPHFSGALVLFVLSLFIWERASFSQALLRTEMNRPGWQMAQLLNKLQHQNYEAAIISPRFGDFYGIFTEFYSNYSFDVLSETQLIDTRKEYKYIISIDEDISDHQYYQRLRDTYSFEKINDVTVIYVD